MKTHSLLLVALVATSLVTPSCMVDRTHPTLEQVRTYNALHLKNPSTPYPKGNLFVTGEPPTIVNEPNDRYDERGVPALISFKTGQ